MFQLGDFYLEKPESLLLSESPQVNKIFLSICPPVRCPFSAWWSLHKSGSGGPPSYTKRPYYQYPVRNILTTAIGLVFWTGRLQSSCCQARPLEAYLFKGDLIVLPRRFWSGFLLFDPLVVHLIWGTGNSFDLACGPELKCPAAIKSNFEFNLQKIYNACCMFRSFSPSEVTSNYGLFFLACFFLQVRSWAVTGRRGHQLW